MTTLAIAAVALVPAAPASATRHRHLPTLLASDGNGYLVRPTSIYYTGDGSGVFGKLRSAFGESGPGRGDLHWTAWNGRRANGAGSDWVKLGTPTATSPFTRLSGSVTATRPRDGHFTRLTISERLHGTLMSATLCIPDKQRVSEWSEMLGGRCLG
jgi:hypothetical protein